MSSAYSISGTVQFQAPANSQQVNEQLNLSTSLTPSGTQLFKSIVTLPNTVAQTTLTGVTNVSTIVLRNLDGTNSISYGPNSAAQAGLLAPGALNIWSPNGNALYAAAVGAGATAQLQIFATPL